MNASNVRTLSDTPDTFIPDCALSCAGGTVGTANKGNVTYSSGSLTVTGSTTLNGRLTQSVSERTKFNIDTSGNAAIATSLCVGTFSPYGTATTGAFNTLIKETSVPCKWNICLVLFISISIFPIFLAGSFSLTNDHQGVSSLKN